MCNSERRRTDKETDKEFIKYKTLEEQPFESKYTLTVLKVLFVVVAVWCVVQYL